MKAVILFSGLSVYKLIIGIVQAFMNMQFSSALMRAVACGVVIYVPMLPVVCGFFVA